MDEATSKFLDNDKSPTRRLGGIDNRGSHFYLALYWAQELASQKSNTVLSDIFKPLAEHLSSNETKIVEELISVQGKTVDVGGYYFTDDNKSERIMRPSSTLNEAIDNF